jgi:TetR/AcrR family transcriptional regulator, regulator of cefoperazone and chloramphenicol sensitivity
VQEDKRKSRSGTGERLLETAIDIFGKHGYEAATTRMITSQAKVNISAIPYYFGGKEGLYRAVISHIVEIIQRETGDIAKTIKNTSFQGESGRLLALKTLQDFLERMISFLVGSSQGQRISRIVLREQMYPSNAYDLVFAGFMEPSLNALTKLITIAGKERDERRAKLRAISIIGQVLVFRVARETVIRALDIEEYSEQELQQIREIIITHTKAALEWE